MDCLYFSCGSSASPFDPTFFLSCTVSNVICCLVFGERFSYDNEHFLSLLKIISQTLKHFSSPVGQVRHNVNKETGLTLYYGNTKLVIVTVLQFLLGKIFY